MRSIVFVALLAACGVTVESNPEVAIEVVEEPKAEAPVAAQADARWDHYGSPFAVNQTTKASEVLAAPETFVGKTLKLEGKAADVCQKAGCWMVVQDGEKTMRVIMKDHAFAVDKAGAGKDCLIEGELVAKDVVAADEEHIKSEAAHPELQPKVAEGSKTYELVASAVAFKKG